MSYVYLSLINFVNVFVRFRQSHGHHGTATHTNWNWKYAPKSSEKFLCFWPKCCDAINKIGEKKVKPKASIDRSGSFCRSRCDTVLILFLRYISLDIHVVSSLLLLEEWRKPKSCNLLRRKKGIFCRMWNAKHHCRLSWHFLDLWPELCWWRNYDAATLSHSWIQSIAFSWWRKTKCSGIYRGCDLVQSIRQLHHPSIHTVCHGAMDRSVYLYTSRLKHAFNFMLFSIFDTNFVGVRILSQGYRTFTGKLSSTLFTWFVYIRNNGNSHRVPIGAIQQSAIQLFVPILNHTHIFLSVSHSKSSSLGWMWGANGTVVFASIPRCLLVY